MIQFRNFALDPLSGELFAGGRRVPLEQQPAKVLTCLLASPGEVVTRAVLTDTIWDRETHVNFDDNLNYCIRHLRRVLGDDARCPRFIETLPKRGYRFVAPVKAADASDQFFSARQARDWWPLAPAATALIGFVLESGPNNHHEVVSACLARLHAMIF